MIEIDPAIFAAWEKTDLAKALKSVAALTAALERARREFLLYAALWQMPEGVVR